VCVAEEEGKQEGRPDILQAVRTVLQIFLTMAASIFDQSDEVSTYIGQARVNVHGWKYAVSVWCMY
jgi:hypothetical protein